MELILCLINHNKTDMGKVKPAIVSVFPSPEPCGNLVDDNEEQMYQTVGLLNTDNIFYTVNRALTAVGYTLGIKLDHNAS